MTKTILASANKEVIIGFGLPFIMIGERINPTGRKTLAEEMKQGNYSSVEAEAIAQVEAGAQVLDVNAGIPLADEPAILAESIRRIQAVVEVPLCIDSSIIKALEAGLRAYKGRALVNSTTGETEVLEQVLPLVKKYDAAVVAISNDESGIKQDVDERFKVAKKIVEHALDYGIKAEDVVVDPLVMPIGAIPEAGDHVFTLLRRLRSELKVNTICGASNISFGIPARHAINNAFLPMVIASGMTSAIVNPLHAGLVKSVRAADVLMGVDSHCISWIKNYKEPSAVDSTRASRRHRRRG